MYTFYSVCIFRGNDARCKEGHESEIEGYEISRQESKIVKIQIFWFGPSLARLSLEMFLLHCNYEARANVCGKDAYSFEKVQYTQGLHKNTSPRFTTRYSICPQFITC